MEIIGGKEGVERVARFTYPGQRLSVRYLQLGPDLHTVRHKDAGLDHKSRGCLRPFGYCILILIRSEHSHICFDIVQALQCPIAEQEEFALAGHLIARFLFLGKINVIIQSPVEGRP